jgi:hypothetical protein
MPSLYRIVTTIQEPGEKRKIRQLQDRSEADTMFTSGGRPLSGHPCAARPEVLAGQAGAHGERESSFPCSVHGKWI